MDLWSRLAELLLRLVDRYDAPAFALLLLVDDAGVALPVPGDLLMTLAGYRVGQGQMSLFWALPLLELGGVLGASIQYWFGARGAGRSWTATAAPCASLPQGAPGSRAGSGVMRRWPWPWGA